MATQIRRAWGLVRWKIAAIIVLTGTSTLLIACGAVAALNVVVRREGANVVEKQIEMLVQSGPIVGSADPDHPGARRPSWLPTTDFTGLVADKGRLEIRKVDATSIFSLPLGSELARQLSIASGMEVTPVPPRPFRVHSPYQRVLRTIEGNFVPGFSQPAAVVLTARNWESGEREDWIAYSVRPGYGSTFEDVARLGSQIADWVWLGAALAILVVFMYAAGVWVSLRLGASIGKAVDDLSTAARQIARGNFAWRTPVSGKDQLANLSTSFNEMAVALERLKQEEATALRIESELHVARSVQQYLFPRTAPAVGGVTVAGQTLAARTVGGDLYDFFNLGKKRIGILCADVSGKGIPAALMMANLQAVARARLNEETTSLASSAGHWVEVLNRDLAGRFGDNRYATLFWAEYNADSSTLSWVNAGNPAPILIHSDGRAERLDADGFPIGMFANAQYAANESVIRPESRLVIFTDGLTDAENATGEEFGDERLIACCRNITPGTDATRSAELLMQAVSEWSAGAEQFDDTTVVVVDFATDAVRRNQDTNGTIATPVKPSVQSGVETTALTGCHSGPPDCTSGKALEGEAYERKT